MYKIHYLLKRDYGIDISCGRVYRLMKQMNLPPISTKKPNFSAYNDQNEYDNHLKQQFNQFAPDTVWVSDITYIKVSDKFYYLCVIIDLFSRKVIAYNISGRPDSALVIETFLLAYKSRKTPYGLMFHSDRGSQYNSFSFRKLLDDLNVVQSFSKKGHPYDNAVAESFFKYLKHEEINRRNYSSLQELKLSVFEYIEGYYNSNHPHSSLGMLTPNQKEQNFTGENSRR
jgi:transposase InsO family protein